MRACSRTECVECSRTVDEWLHKSLWMSPLCSMHHSVKDQPKKFVSYSSAKLCYFQIKFTTNKTRAQIRKHNGELRYFFCLIFENYTGLARFIFGRSETPSGRLNQSFGEDETTVVSFRTNQ